MADDSRQEPRGRERADEVFQALESLQRLTIPYIRTATESTDHGASEPNRCIGAPFPDRTILTDSHPPSSLQAIFQPHLPSTGLGLSGLRISASSILDHSVNTWSPGFLDKLYASPDAAGVAAEHLLSILNTNVHVYSVSPALTVIEKHVATALAQRFGLLGSHAGGITMPGGSASNSGSMLVARNVMFPAIQVHGMGSLGAPLAVFASSASHYSISVAAVQLGIGSANVYSVPVLVTGPQQGAMDPRALRDALERARGDGKQPFYVCATAGTTVDGAYDPIRAIAEVCRQYRYQHQQRLWLHVDACWGGAAIFSNKHGPLLDGSAMADSIAFSPHKMLGVPITCAFLLGADMRKFYAANRLEAGYLFHEPEESATMSVSAAMNGHDNGSGHDSDDDDDNADLHNIPAWRDVHDLAKYTHQCGRRGDSLKFYMAWQYHGSAGFAQHVDAAFAAARRLAQGLAVLGEVTDDTAHTAKNKGADGEEHTHRQRRGTVILLNSNPPPCCQVCFRYVPQTERCRSRSEQQGEEERIEDTSWTEMDTGVKVRNNSGCTLKQTEEEERRSNTRTTRTMTALLRQRGWMIDYTTGLEGEYLRVVCNRYTSDTVVDGLVRAIVEVGEEALAG